MRAEQTSAVTFAACSMTSRGKMEDAVSEMMRARVEQMFLKSDVEGKGFIVKRDMQRMIDEVPLTPEQLEDVFDSLDVGNNGYLTVEQFLCGFGNFLSGSSAMKSTQSKRRIATQSSQSIFTSSDSFEDQFQILIDQLKETDVFENVDVLRSLCDDVNLYGSQEIQMNLEVFLRQVVKDVMRQKKLQKGLEDTMRARREQDEVQVRRLFDEMEAHLLEEKHKMVTQVDQRVRLVRQQMEAELSEKEEALKEVTSEKHQISVRLHLTKVTENALRQDNARLADEKTELEGRCDQQSQEIARLMLRLDQQDAQAQEQYMTEGYRLARRISVEKHGLLEQLELLHEIAETLENFKRADKVPTKRVTTH